MDYHAYSALLNKPYISGFQDCYTLTRGFYLLNYGISLPDYARPEDFQSSDFNLISRLKVNPDFISKPVSKNDLVEGDVLIFRVASDVENHFGVYVGNGLFIHHLLNTKSKEEGLDHRWFRRVISVLRHVDCPVNEQRSDLQAFLSPALRKGVDIK